MGVIQSNDNWYSPELYGELENARGIQVVTSSVRNGERVTGSKRKNTTIQEPNPKSSPQRPQPTASTIIRSSTQN